MAARTTTTGSGYDREHRRLAAAVVRTAVVCAECGLPPTPTDPLQGGHIVARSLGGQNIAGNYQAEHRSCNIRKGGANRRRRKG